MRLTNRPPPVGLLLGLVLIADRAWSADASEAVGDEAVKRVQVSGGAPAIAPRAPVTNVPPRAGIGANRPAPARPTPRPSPTELSRAPTSAPPSSSTGTTPSASSGLTDLGQFSGGGVPLMLGDLAPLYGASALRAGSPASAVRVPWARGYKMADNQSPRPQDRVFFAFNFFDNLAQPAGSSLHDVKVYREFFGVEKTFFAQNLSIGLRLPLNSITARGVPAGQGGSSTGVGDLTVFVKGILWQDRPSGSLLSGGLAVTTPNSGANFAGAPFAKTTPAASLQPFLGYIANFGDWYVQGFTGANLPTDPNVVTMYYNDIGTGYYLYRARDPNACLSAVVPTFEVHVNTPLDHRTTLAVGAPPGVPDVVDLTFGCGFALKNRAVVSAGIVNPVTGPRPFDLEALVFLNVFFGPTRRGVSATPPPSL